MNLIGRWDNSSRVNRGGSWYYFPSFARVAIRIGNTPGSRLIILGFRLHLGVQ